MDVTPMTPITSVKILKNVPLDKTYKDTLDFSSVSSQVSFFTAKAKYTFTDLTPIRMQNSIRVPIVADNLYDCNYIMFQNANFGTKWFYAFITSIQFVNPAMCTINFEIDVWQTWQLDITVKPSFVEREHINIDTAGANLIDENLELGDYVSADFDGTGLMGAKSIVIASTTDKDAVKVTGGTYCGIYSGLYFNVFDSYQGANAMIETLTSANKSDAIVSIFMMPTKFVGDVGGSAKSYNITKPMKLDNINGYVPKNKKLFTHPYNFLYVTNLQGTSAEFKYEYFDAINCTFGVAGDMSCNPQIFLYPQNYKGVSANYNEKMVLDGFPQCSYTTDSFKAWLAQNGASTAVSMLGSALALSNPVTAPMGMLGVAGTLAKVSATSALPRQAHGANGASANFATGIKDFAFMHMSIRKEYAQLIDEYFSMYGYATHRVKTPNITGRPSWNYVKTIDVKIVGSIPFGDMVIIKDMFNKGVTFWHGDYVGDYSRANN
jgi:hypothetical protein